MKRKIWMTIMVLNLLIALLISCNDNATVGIYKHLAHPFSAPLSDSDTPLPPRSLIFYDEDTLTLYYRSYNKIFAIADNEEATLLFETSSQFDSAIFHSEVNSGLSILMKTNDEQGEGAAFWQVLPLDAEPVKKPEPTFINSVDPDEQIDEMTAFHLLSPGYIIVEGTKGGERVTTFGMYREATNELEIVGSVVGTEGLKLKEVMHASGYQLWGFNRDKPKIITFTKGVERKYRYYDSPWYGLTMDFPHEIAAFVVLENDDDMNNYLFILTVEGKLYSIDVSDIEQGNFTFIYDTGQSYPHNAFIAAHQEWGEDTYLITRPDKNTEGVTVLSLDEDFKVSGITNLTDGYAKDLADATVISSFRLSRGVKGSFYIDTIEKGLLKTIINNPLTGAGSSEVVEGFRTE